MQYPSKVKYKQAVINETYPTELNGNKSFTPILVGNEPQLLSGGNAIVFKVRDDKDETFAIKLFNTDLAGRQERLVLISQYLNQKKLNHFIDFEYIEKFIYVDIDDLSEDEKYFPGVLMKWVNAESLEVKLGEIIKQKDSAALSTIAENFKKMCLDLLGLGIAHGDLKLSNILIDEKLNLKLIDYDGLFVPNLKGQSALEIGTPAYQHIKRTITDYNESIDHFSILSIYTSLLALSHQPTLYDDYNDGDNIIFKEADYASPDDSALFLELLKLEEVKKYAYFLKLSCKSNNIDIPAISKILNGKFPQPQIELTHSPLLNLVGDSARLSWITHNCTYLKVDGKLVENCLAGELAYQLKANNVFQVEYGNEIESIFKDYNISCEKRPIITYFKAEKNNIKHNEAVELTWSAKHFSKLFIRYEATKIDVTGKKSISIPSISSKTKVTLEATAKSTDFSIKKVILINVFNPIVLNVTQDKKITYPNHPVKLLIHTENADKLTLLPEGKDITNVREVTILPQASLEYEIEAKNKLFSTKSSFRITTIPYPVFDEKLVTIPSLKVDVPAPMFSRRHYKKQSLTSFEKRTLEVSKYIDFVSPFLLFNTILPGISRIKKYIIIKLNPPSKIK